MHAAQLWPGIARAVESRLPPHIPPGYWSSFERRFRPRLVHILQEALEDARAARIVPGGAPPSALPPDGADLWTPGRRTAANLSALRLLAHRRPGEPLEPHERATLLAYSGWGGLSIEKVRGELPPGLPAPDPRGLIHEYYTPSRVAWALARRMAPLVASLRERLGHVPRALEPSAGIGRFPNAFFGAPGVGPLDWTFVELSPLSARILAALWPDAPLHPGAFESYLAQRLAEGALPTFDLIVANPPYGPRGELVTVDPDPRFRVKEAYAYFLLRCVELLAPGGLGAFLIPAGFLSGVTHTRIREAVLRSAHLVTAYRLPSEGRTRKDPLFPGANLVTDLVIVEKRRGRLAEVLPEDAGILAGSFFADHPALILGEERHEGGEGPRARRRYAVIGDFTDLPPLTPRPLGEGPLAETAAPAVKARGGLTRQDIPLADLPPDLERAVGLGRRLDTYLTAVSRGALEDAASAHAELKADLLAWRAAHGSPVEHAGLALLARKGSVGAERLRAAFTRHGELIPSLAEPPQVTPVYRGEPTLLGQADWLYRQRGPVRARELQALFAEATGRTPTATEIVDTLVAAGWCLDGEKGNRFVPEAVYYTGDLWPKVDRARALQAAGHPHAGAQLARLMEIIRPAVLEDLLQDLTPRESWLPVEAVQAWAYEALGGSYWRSRNIPLRRDGALLTFEGTDYAKLAALGSAKLKASQLPEKLVWFMGWANHHLALFRPPQPTVVGEDGEPRRQPLDEVRLEIAAEWTKAFRTWLATKPELGAQVEEAYNRALRGYVPPEFTAEPLSIARWSPDAPSLYPYQAKGARRVLAARRGLLAFDVGLGKSYTGCAILARARQEGWARRPVVLVPNSIVWKWKRDFARVLPDYRVLVIGSTRRALSHGPRKGRVVAQPDTPAERAEKWTAFQSGLADVVLLTYSALGRTRLDPDVLTEYVDGVAALRRQIALGRARRDGKAEKGETERQKATSAEATRAWLAERLEPPKGWEYDPGIEWHALGVDFLMVDESQNFKNLFMPEEREGGIPDAMGGTEESKRAWQLDFRCASVRKHTGGAGVVLLSATPAKNGPVEFYSAIHLVDPAAWERIGITDPEAFIDRFCAFEARPAQNAQGKLTVRQACVAFKNLHELRDVVFRYADFKTAEDVGLRIPDAQNVHHRVDLDEAQIDAIQGAWREITELKDRMKHLQGDANARMREILRLKMMGVAARVDLIAIHPALPGSAGMSRAALAAIDPHSGKVDAVVETVVSTALTACTLPGKGTPVCAADESFCLSCGHIVFVENVAAHAWLKAALVEAGVPAERIAVLNAAAAPDPETRQQIAEAFNGVGCPGDEEYVAPAFDVVIANGVAYEGVDLQRRTCAIHHVDLPWDPSTLQQRNGRGVRQGNTFGAVRIHYYLGRPSGDGRRLSLIDKKRSWMASLVKGQARTTNNPAAAVNVSVEELLLDIVPPEERARVLREREAEQEALERARRARVAAMASRMLSQAHARFRRAEKAPDAAEAGRLRAEGDQLLELLAAVDKDAWPWFSLATRVRTEAAFLPEVGPPLFPGMGVRRGAGLVEVGRAGAEVDGKPVLGLRDPTSYKPQQWTAHPAASLNAWAAELTPEDLAPGVDPLDAEALAAKFKADVVAGGFPGFTGWELAPAEWQARAWPVVEEGVITTLLTGRYAYSVVPIEHHGALAVAHVLELKHTLRGGRVLPPTEAGWEALLRLAKRSSVPWGQLNTMTRVWWKRPMPRGLTQAQET